MKPRAPVEAADFANPDVRATWIREKGLRVFSLWDPVQPLRELDLFVESPIPFGELWERSELVSLDSTAVRVASIDDLIALKEIAGCDIDRSDVVALREIQHRRESTR